MEQIARVKNLKVCGDSRLVVSQVNCECEIKDETTPKYRRFVKVVMTQFDECYMEHILGEENVKANALSKFATSEIENYLGSVYFQVLKTPNIDSKLVAPINLKEC